MPHSDSIDKIVSIYLASVCKKPFRYKGQIFKPKPLTISPLIFRGFTCPAKCGGRRPRFPPGYLPSRTEPYKIETRPAGGNGGEVPSMSPTPHGRPAPFCRSLGTTRWGGPG